MARPNSMLAALAAASLTLAQPATAAAARTGSPIGENEAITEAPGGTLVMFVLGAIILVFVIMAITDDDGSDSPSSP